MPDFIIPPVDEPEDRDPANDYVTESELCDRGIDPNVIRILVPHATELRALDGSRCWSRVDLAALLESNP